MDSDHSWCVREKSLTSHVGNLRIVHLLIRWCSSVCFVSPWPSVTFDSLLENGWLPCLGWGELLPQARGIKYLRVLFNEGQVVQRRFSLNVVLECYVPKPEGKSLHLHSFPQLWSWGLDWGNDVVECKQSEGGSSVGGLSSATVRGTGGSTLSHLRWFRYLIRTSPGCWPLKDFWAHPTGRRR